MVNLRGIFFMTLSMGGFAVEDLFLKILSETVPVSQILIYVGISGTLLLSIISIIKRIPIVGNDIFSNKLNQSQLNLLSHKLAFGRFSRIWYVI